MNIGAEFDPLSECILRLAECKKKRKKRNPNNRAAPPGFNIPHINSEVDCEYVLEIHIFTCIVNFVCTFSEKMKTFHRACE